jgi:hypothetical protein
MLARTNLRRDDLFYLTLADVDLMHTTTIKDTKNHLSHLYNISDRIAEWIVKAGTGLKPEFKRQDLRNKLIENPFGENKKPGMPGGFPKNYSNKKEAERILKIWKLDKK